MNNGCYCLTKGQDSATADQGSTSKSGHVNMYEGIDLCALAVQLGATYVAQSFSGDKEQLIPLIKAAISHKGFSFINVISPGVTVNNNVGSTKSYDYVREHNETVALVDFVPIQEEIKASYKENTVTTIEIHDGSEIQLRKLSHEWNHEDKVSIISALVHAKERQEILTGLLYVDRNSTDLHEILNTTDIPLNQLNEKNLNPGQKELEKICSQLM